MEVLKEIRRRYAEILEGKNPEEISKHAKTCIYLSNVEKLDKETCEKIKLEIGECKDKRIQKLLKLLHPEKKGGGTIDGYFGGDSKYIFETNDKYLKLQTLLKKNPSDEDFLVFLKEHFPYLSKELQKGKSNTETIIKTNLHNFLDMDISKFLKLFNVSEDKKKVKQNYDELMNDKIKKNTELLQKDNLGKSILEYNSEDGGMQSFKNSMALLNCYNAIKNHKSINTTELKNIITKFHITKFRERQLPDNLKNLENFHYECNDEIPCMIKKLLEKEIYALNFIRDKDIFEDGFNKYIKNCEIVYKDLIDGDHEKFLICTLYSQFSKNVDDVFAEYFEQMGISKIDLLNDGIINIEAFVEFSKNIHRYSIIIK